MFDACKKFDNLQSTKITMKNGPLIDHLPLYKTGDFPVRYVHQRVFLNTSSVAAGLPVDPHNGGGNSRRLDGCGG